MPQKISDDDTNALRNATIVTHARENPYLARNISSCFWGGEYIKYISYR